MDREEAVMQQPITPAELAEGLGADQKRVRKFLRSITPEEQQPGRGNRWSLPGGKRNFARLQKQYNEWAQMHTRHPAAS
jgi:hypothetical protein